MKLYGLANRAFRFFYGRASSNAPWQVRYISRIIATRVLNDYRVSHRNSLSLQARLFKDTVGGAGCQVIGRLPRHCNAAFLRWVLKLAMTPATSNLRPSIVPQHSKYRPHLLLICIQLDTILMREYGPPHGRIRQMVSEQGSGDSQTPDGELRHEHTSRRGSGPLRRQ